MSSNIQGITYDPDQEVLTVTFASGRAYEYAGVPLSVANAFNQTWSQSSFFHDNIRDDYSFTRL